MCLETMISVLLVGLKAMFVLTETELRPPPAKFSPRVWAIPMTQPPRG